MSSPSVSRPIEVTIVAIMVFVQAGIEALSGAGLIAGSLMVSDVEIGGESLPPAVVTVIGSFSLLIAVIDVIVAIGLLRGNRAARMLVTILQILTILTSVLGFAAAAHGQLTADLFNLALAVVILAVLWSGRASAFFAQRRGARA